MPQDSPEQRIETIRYERAEKAAELQALDRARRRYGWVPNTIGVMAHSVSVAELYLGAGELNEGGTLSQVEREFLAVLTAAHNECSYCLTAHNVALSVLGLTGEEISRARIGHSDDPRSGSILQFARSVLIHRGAVPDEDFSLALQRGLDQSTLLDIVAVIAENTLGNYVNNVARTTIDPLLQRGAARVTTASLVEVTR